jgi:putative ABC transport system substrate-binding protein
MRIRCKKIARAGGSRRWLAYLAAACAGLLWLHILSTPALAKEFERPIRIGVVSPYWENTDQLNGLRQGLEELGYRESIDFVIGVRFTSGDTAALPGAVRELLGTGPDILFADSHWSALAVNKADPNAPLVFLSGFDPVRTGLVKSFANPGGNSTGLVSLFSALLPKILETTTRILPGKKRFLTVFSGNFLGKRLGTLGARVLENLRHAEGQLQIDLDIKIAGSEEEGRRILDSVRRKDVDGILITDFSYNLFGKSLKASRREKIPLITDTALGTEGGALASYGPDYGELGRQSARLMDKVIRGENPGNIPIEVNDQILFVINLKVARELGIEIPREVLYSANRIIR